MAKATQKSTRKLISQATLVMGHPDDPLNPEKRITIEPGAKFEIDSDTAERMIRGGHAAEERVPASSSQASAAAPAKPKGEALTGAIVDAIGKLDQSSEEHFTPSGKPSTYALAAQLGYAVSVGERDEAWAVVKGPRK